MSSFTKPLVYGPTGKRRDGRAIYILREPFTYELGFLGSGVSIDVPVDFETDFASIPGFADDWFGLNPTDGLVKKAAVIHDFLYADHAAIERVAYALKEISTSEFQTVSVDLRKFADCIFLEAMGFPRQSGFAGVIQNLKRRIIFLSVRIFGDRPFSRFNISQESTK